MVIVAGYKDRMALWGNPAQACARASRNRVSPMSAAWSMTPERTRPRHASRLLNDTGTAADEQSLITVIASALLAGQVLAQAPDKE